MGSVIPTGERESSNVCEELQHDLEHAQTVGFDSLAHYLLSLCLEGDLKTAIEGLQLEIEALQGLRYHTLSTDTDKATSGEIEKSKKRDELVAGFYENCLTQVLDIANDDEIWKYLQEFNNSLSERKSLQYAYIRLCNKALDKLKDIQLTGARDPSRLNICLHYNDNSTSHIPVKTTQRPEVMITSDSVIQWLSQVDQNHSLEQRSENQSAWRQVLRPDVLDIHKMQSQAAIRTMKDRVRFDTQRKCWGDMQKEEVNFGSQSATLKQDPSLSAPTCAVGMSLHGGNRTTPDPANKRQWSDDSQTVSQSSNKRKRTDESATSSVSDENETERTIVDGARVAEHLLEMMSIPGVHHAFGISLSDDYLTVWYADRQGIIVADAISLIADFPRVLVLLFAFQRFDLCDWGIVAKLNPNAVEALCTPLLGPCCQAAKENIELTLGNEDFVNPIFVARNLSEKVTLDTSKAGFLSGFPRCIEGRATAVLQCRDGLKQFACKISNPEILRTNEGQTLEFIQDLVATEAAWMKTRTPSIYFYGDVKGTGTRRIRSILGINWRGDRILRILIINRLEPLTLLKGQEFVNAWLDAVTSHAFLWKHGIEHGDPSLSNIMYDPQAECGVLMDFDLSLFQWLPRNPGTGRTGTVPFMSIDLLTEEYGNGEIQRQYYHELEAFIWILPFTFLRFQNAQPHSDDMISKWITSSYEQCLEKKLAFIMSPNLAKRLGKITDDFKICRGLLERFCKTLRRFRITTEERSETADKQNSSSVLPLDFHYKTSEDFWHEFLAVLQDDYPGLDFKSYVTELQGFKPLFASENSDHIRAQRMYTDLQCRYSQTLLA